MIRRFNEWCAKHQTSPFRFVVGWTLLILESPLLLLVAIGKQAAEIVATTAEWITKAEIWWYKPKR